LERKEGRKINLERKEGRKINLERKEGRKINLERKEGRKIFQSNQINNLYFIQSGNAINRKMPQKLELKFGKLANEHSLHLSNTFSTADTT